MLVWSGWGILAFILLAAGGGGGTALGTALGTGAGAPPSDVNLGTAVGLALAGVAVWFVGARLNRPVDGFHQATGEPVVYKNQHKLFWIPMQYFAFAGAAAAVGTAVMSVTA